MEDKFSHLRRPRYPIPSFVQKALNENRLTQAYHSRPAYQQNDYIGWITRAKHIETQEKRLNEMLSDLKAGNIYMGMPYHSKK
jgi:uncharacterized protein YdeI (YjbR/CyaY-like superfamily)